jgi:Tol biopolymer transport system component
MSPSAGHVAFSSLSNDLVPGDTLAGRDVFVKNRTTGATTRASVRSDGSQPQYTATGTNNDSRDPSISADGSVVAFASTNRDLAPETNPVPGDTWQTYDIYVRDVSSANPADHVTERITVGLGDTKANGSSSTPIVSGDGRYVWFASAASNLVAGDTNGYTDLFVHDRQTSTTTRLNVTGATGQPLDGDLQLADVTPNGRHVLFDSAASTLVTGDTNGASDVFLLDTLAPTSTAVKRASGPVSPQSNGASFAGSVSDDGRYVTFQSAATNLVAGDTNARTDVFLTDMTNRRTQRISTDADRNQLPGTSSGPSISGNGTSVVYLYQPPGGVQTIRRVQLNLP